MKIERRFIPQVRASVVMQKRADGIVAPMISGYASVYYDGTTGTEYFPWDGLTERISPGAFDKCMKANPDIRALFNHEPNFILGRTAAGTCRVSCDKVGMRYEIDSPDTQCGRDVSESIKRGDITGSSFAFSCNPGGSRWIDQGEGRWLREITDAEVFDVSPVTYPAYGGTTAAVRTAYGGVDDLRAEFEAHRKGVEHQRTQHLDMLAMVAKVKKELATI